MLFIVGCDNDSKRLFCVHLVEYRSHRRKPLRVYTAACTVWVMNINRDGIVSDGA